MQHFDLRGCLCQNSFPVFSPLNWGKDIFPCVPPGRDLFWYAIRWENVAENQYLKWITLYEIKRQQNFYYVIFANIKVKE